MTTKYFAAAIMATLLVAATSTAQSGADLLQKGIYAQETLGDLDGAIQIYRQVTGSATAPKQLAAQAQYQLVLCMLQKGDRAGASHELDLLARNFPDQQEYINKARKLIPGGSTLLAPPWIEGEASQLNIKRGGVFTGEYLYYSATPWRNTVEDQVKVSTDSGTLGHARDIYLCRKLVTKTSERTVRTLVDRDTMQRKERISLDSNDVLGDASAAPFAGPAIDAEPLVFQMRLLPLAVGYKTTLTTLPFLIGHGVPKAVELVVTAVEPVQTLAGKFNCYKVSLASLGQTFWIGVDGARPLVKFQSGNVEAELVKVWGPSVFDDALAFLKKAGWTVTEVRTAPPFETEIERGTAHASAPGGAPYGRQVVNVYMQRIYTPPADVEGAVRNSCSRNGAKPDSVQARTVAGHPSVTCLANGNSNIDIWVATDSLILRFSATGDIPTFRWIFEPILDTIDLH
jgi:hypothetical protein